MLALDMSRDYDNRYGTQASQLDQKPSLPSLPPDHPNGLGYYSTSAPAPISQLPPGPGSHTAGPPGPANSSAPATSGPLSSVTSSTTTSAAGNGIPATSANNNPNNTTSRLPPPVQYRLPLPEETSRYLPAVPYYHHYDSHQMPMQQQQPPPNTSGADMHGGPNSGVNNNGNGNGNNNNNNTKYMPMPPMLHPMSSSPNNGQQTQISYLSSAPQVGAGGPHYVLSSTAMAYPSVSLGGNPYPPPLPSTFLPQYPGLAAPDVSGGQSKPPPHLMTTFNSKLSMKLSKKHVCSLCNKPFTRPSSLQTHMYSHTGEKPFKCEYEGCGRQFSVVSNLRRHKKIHSGQPNASSSSYR